MCIRDRVEADQALVKKKSAEWKAIMEGMSFNAFLLFHSKMNELMKTKKMCIRDRKLVICKNIFIIKVILHIKALFRT